MIDAPGCYPIVIAFFEATGGESMEMAYNPGIHSLYADLNLVDLDLKVGMPLRYVLATVATGGAGEGTVCALVGFDMPVCVHNAHVLA